MMKETNYWLSPILRDHDSYYEAYRVVGSNMEEELGKVLVKQDDHKYALIVERSDIGQKKFESTDNQDLVSTLIEIAASSLYYS